MSHIDTKTEMFQFQGQTHLCTVTQSPQQLLYNLYNIVGLTEIKGHTMLQFSFMMLSIYDNDNFTVEAEVAKDKFVVEAKEKMRSLMSVLPNMTTEYHRCEPDKQVAGETYLEVTKLLQVILKSEPIKRNKLVTSFLSICCYISSTNCIPRIPRATLRTRWI